MSLGIVTKSPAPSRSSSPQQQLSKYDEVLVSATEVPLVQLRQDDVVADLKRPGPHTTICDGRSNFLIGLVVFCPRGYKCYLCRVASTRRLSFFWPILSLLVHDMFQSCGIRYIEQISIYQAELSYEPIVFPPHPCFVVEFRACRGLGISLSLGPTALP